jgi:hypothetical protein
VASAEKRMLAGRARRYARYRDPSGKQRTKSFDRKVDAQRFLTTVESEKLSGSYFDPSRSKLTVGEWSQQWLAGQAHLKSSTRERYEGILRKHVLPRWGSTRLSNVNHSAVQQWVADLAKVAQPATPPLRSTFHE